MTDQHPLTDEVIEEIAHSGYIDDYGRYNYAADDLRAAADWQLEQVIEWVSKFGWDHFEHELYESDFIYKLKQAMRPTTAITQENN